MNLTTIELKSTLFSEDFSDKFEDYLLWVIQNVSNPESEFDIRTKNLRNSGEEVIRQSFDSLINRGYDMMITTSGNHEEIVGHIAFQRYNSRGIGERNANNNWQVFQHYINPKMRRQGITVIQAKNFLHNARERGVSRVRLGGDSRVPAVQKIVNYLKREEESMNVSIDVDSYWVEIRHP